METDRHELPRIFKEGGTWLVWTANEIETLWTTAHVIGAATMTAPFFPKQSNELSLPYEIMPCEVKWCHEKGFCRLVVAKFKIDFCEIDKSKIPVNYDKEVKIDDESEYDIVFTDPPEVDEIEYKTYCILRQKGFWVTDGKNYGCNFSIYKEEPWKCHSSALVWCEESILNTRNLIQHVRIAESTKKSAVTAILYNNEIKFIDFTRYKAPEEKDDMIIQDPDENE
ncbi:tRNA intron endonuclease, catalytic C-terminal domain containing protein [Tritrichomonas foetus]|uniref:tRNA-intron lyase n=1 Tax=Tritrichomonas foetus TaxID=1144522 RepID=A0A1J4K4N8_9EUKA|nr:tRNA intron endonuclease, catalytic C-terminal domain containing protein [Tritrichomonas foetus]|eukprot:OHT05816.1 tRNA intron endonuclease, catalytic C-terminal domain containing protein [Tritrichomonas foetus]